MYLQPCIVSSFAYQRCHNTTKYKPACQDLGNPQGWRADDFGFSSSMASLASLNKLKELEAMQLDIVYGTEYIEYIATLLEVNIEWKHMKPPWLRTLQSLTGPQAASFWLVLNLATLTSNRCGNYWNASTV